MNTPRLAKILDELVGSLASKRGSRGRRLFLPEILRLPFAARMVASRALGAEGECRWIVVVEGRSLDWTVDALDALLERQGASGAAAFPPSVVLEGGIKLPSGTVEKAARCKFLHSLRSDGHSMLVVTPASLMERVGTSDGGRSSGDFRLEPAMTMEPDELCERLEALGYERSEAVAAPGSYSRRGAVVDVFSWSEEWPLRMELFGDGIERMELFDPASQLSFAESSSYHVVGGAFGNEPAREEGDAGGVALSSLLAEAGLPVLWLVSSAECLQVASRWAPLLGETALEQAVKELAAAAPSFVVLTQAAPPGCGPLASVDSGFMELPSEGGAESLKRNLRALDLEPSACVFLASSSSEAARGGDMLGALFPQGGVVVEDVGVSLPGAACSRERGMVLLGAPALWGGAPVVCRGRSRPERRIRGGRGSRSGAAAVLRDLLDLSEGELVVHDDHGIARFEGVETLRIEGVVQDYVLLAFAGDDRLYVPVHQLDKISRYVGVEGERAPALSRLGSGRWRRQKEKAREDAARVAAELLSLHARRELEGGIAFSPDTEWQRQLEDAFPFVETEDQLRALEEIKRDMESPRPMDRLLCGDVGFGKTELAVRAAFKAVQDGYQAVVLAATTLLAQQHHKTFSERLAPFPVRVECLSRLQTQAEQRRILRDTAAGRVDVLIGTHRMLSPDVKFARLGLLVIDEEHRFGVRAKERLKELRAGVDVLSLSATPIPRTLHMALGGLKAISTISTPPAGRLPVKTFVARFDPELVRSAVLEEIGRGGQVYYVFNRIDEQEEVARFLGALLPGVRLGRGHGRMGRRELERLMERFAAGEFDVLLSTAIVECGLDVPTANTIIVHDAHRFGLAQLYQLRGRVGRSTVQAYAYLLVPPAGESVLGLEAMGRLKAMEEFSGLGDGLRLAMRDLQIRGAGAVLGARQHGFVAGVGLETYATLLAEELERLRASSRGRGSASGPRENVPAAGCIVDLRVDSCIPDSYVPSSSQRMHYYRRLADVASEEELERIEAEMRDRYGPHPPELLSLFEVVQLKLEAVRCGITSIVQRGGEIRFVGEGIDMSVPLEGERNRAITALAKNVLASLGRMRGR